MPDSPDLDALIAQITDSKKYREVGLCDDTVRDILLTELARHPKTKDAVQAAKRKLHEVMALYLGDPDYSVAFGLLDDAFATGDEARIRATCRDLLRTHDSTRERLPLLDTFFAQVFAVTGVPAAVLDIASGLNPLALPWMNLPPGARFFAYEIHQQRVDLLNHFFALAGPRYAVTGLAIMGDILVSPPAESGDVALLLKETHRMEKRRRGIVSPMLDALQVRWLVLSSPTRSRTGRHALIETNRQQVHDLIADRPWRMVAEIEFENELVYCIDKTPGGVP